MTYSNDYKFEVEPANGSFLVADVHLSKKNERLGSVSISQNFDPDTFDVGFYIRAGGLRGFSPSLKQWVRILDGAAEIVDGRLVFIGDQITTDEIDENGGLTGWHESLRDAIWAAAKLIIEREGERVSVDEKNKMINAGISQLVGR